MNSHTKKANKPFLIGVDLSYQPLLSGYHHLYANQAGGTASGKSTVCRKIMAKLGQDCQRRVALIKQDSFYRQLDEVELQAAKLGKFNFDHPDAIDDVAMYQALKDILSGKPVKLPIHDYHDNCPKQGESNEIQSADVVLFEGVLIFYFPLVRDMFNMKLFVDTDSDTRLSRRVIRDVRERGRPLEIVLDQYDQSVKPAFEEFCQPTKKYADMIIPRGAENEVAIGLINHNVTFLLSSEVTVLRNGPHRPAPLKVNLNNISPAIKSPSLDDVKNSIETTISTVLSNCTTVLNTTQSFMRSRSNSRTSSIANADPQRAIDYDIKEELDANDATQS